MKVNVTCTQKTKTLYNQSVFYQTQFQTIENGISSNKDRVDLTITTNDNNQFVVGKNYSIEIEED